MEMRVRETSTHNVGEQNKNQKSEKTQEVTENSIYFHTLSCYRERNSLSRREGRSYIQSTKLEGRLRLSHLNECESVTQQEGKSWIPALRPVTC